MAELILLLIEPCQIRFYFWKTDFQRSNLLIRLYNKTFTTITKKVPICIWLQNGNGEREVVGVELGKNGSKQEKCPHLVSLELNQCWHFILNLIFLRLLQQFKLNRCDSLCLKLSPWSTVVPHIPSPSRPQLLSYLTGTRTRLNTIKPSGISVWADIFRIAYFASLH